MSCVPIKKNNDKKPCENSEYVITVKKQCKEPEPQPKPVPCPGPVVKTINGITYFKLQSPYEGDYTKNCGLLGNEIDENFFFLRSNDIKTGRTEEADGKKYLVLERYMKPHCKEGGEIWIDITDAEDVPYKFDFKDGYITITFPDGHEERIGKFLVEGDNVTVATDATINGDGSCKKPLSVDLAYRTGTYEPADFFADLTCSDTGITLPSVGYGHAFVTKERASRFGRLYNHWEAEKIAAALGNPDRKCGWRLPTNEDWAKLLNEAEMCDGCANHDDPTMTWHGCLAGPRLKSIDYWEEKDGFGPTNNFDFSIYPVGTCPDSSSAKETVEESFAGLYESTAFWTSTSANGMYLARLFSFAHNDVQLIAKAPNEMLSIRLVKDMDDDSLDVPEYDYVLDNYVPVVLSPDGTQMWTKLNIDFTNYEGFDETGSYVPEAWMDVEGEDLVAETKFYYNAQGKERLHKRMMSEGESVVILHEDYETGCDTAATPYVTSANTAHEWRVYTDPETGEDELIDTLDALKNEFSKEFDEIYEAISGLSEDLAALSGFVESAYDEMQSGFTSAFTAIDETNELLETVIESVGLSGDGSYVASEFGLTSGANSVMEAIEILDQTILENEEVTAAALNDLNGRVNELSGAVEDISDKIDEVQAEVDNIEEGVGLDEYGNYIPKTGTIYLNEADSIEDEISTLDQVVASAMTEIEELQKKTIEAKDESIVVEVSGYTTYVGLNIDQEDKHIKIGENGIWFDGEFKLDDGEDEDFYGN